MSEYTFDASITIEADTESAAVDSILDAMLDIEAPTILYAEGADPKHKKALLKLYNRTEALKGCIDALERCERGHTHWEGCEKQHPSCAAIQKAREALNGD